AQVMEKHKLIEKHAAEMGISDLTVNWINFSGAGAGTDAFLAGQVDILSVGASNLLVLWERSKGAVRGLVSLSALPLTLISRDPDIQTIADLTSDDKIAVPTIKVSTQAILLQMEAAKVFGPENAEKLDDLTVQLGHPDAVIA